jgi:glycosyltransferase involved in cell wall biosynthesis
VSLLSSRVGVAAVRHSDDPEYYDAARRWGRFWDVAVAVSRRVAEEAARRCPTLPVEVIPHAVPCPVEVTARPRRPGTLKMIYAGALKRYQKRIFDLLHIARSLNRAGIDYRLTVAGGGPDEASFLRSARGLPGVHPVGTVPPDAMSDLYREHDVFLLPSDFEGFPLALAEAMAQGCVPVVRDIASGVPELVRDGENGFVIPHGRPEIFTERLVSLARQPGTLNERSANAHRTILENFSDERRWAGRYLDLFEKCLARRATERRADGRAVSPPVFPIYRREAWKRRLSELWRGGWKR